MEHIKVIWYYFYVYIAFYPIKMISLYNFQVIFEIPLKAPAVHTAGFV